jgi:hypothetical protein
MRSFKIPGAGLILLALAAAFLLSGCSYDAYLVVKDAEKRDIAILLKDYCGINGYSMTYANDETGTYRIVLGHSTTRGVDTSETFTVYNKIGSADTKTLIGQSTTVNTSNPTRQLTAALAVMMTQQGPDVYLSAQSAGDLDVGRSFEVFIESLRNRGYALEIIR